MSYSENKTYGRKVIRRNKIKAFLAWCVFWSVVASIITIFILGFVHLICCFKAEASTHSVTETRIVPEEIPVPIVAEVVEEPIVEQISLGEYRLTAYCSCEKCCGVWALNRPIDEYGQPIINTASGERAIQGITVAADTNVLPFGTKIYIDGHEYIVQDRGGAIKGNRIDVYFEHHQEALEFGVQYKEIFTMKEGEVIEV